MTETLTNGYSSESAQRELSNEYQQDRVWMVFVKSLHPCALDESSLSIGRVKQSTGLVLGSVMCNPRGLLSSQSVNTHWQGLTLRFQARGPKRSFDNLSGQKQDFCIIIFILFRASV